MIVAKEAVQKAIEYLFDVVGEIDHPTNVMLEGLRKAENEEWIVDVSYERSGVNQPSSLDVLLGKNVRQYKEIRLDSDGNGISLGTVKPSVSM